MSLQNKALLSDTWSRLVKAIDNLMTDAIAFGSQSGKETIDTEIILAAVDKQNLA